MASMSGRSALSTWLRHCDCSELRVTVKFTKVTREQMAGGNSTVGSRVDKKMTNVGDRSMSWSPRVISTRPPVRRNSRFSTGFRIGS